MRIIHFLTILSLSAAPLAAQVRIDSPAQEKPSQTNAPSPSAVQPSTSGSKKQSTIPWDKAVRIIEHASKEPENQVVVGNDTSHVNWTAQYVEAKGWSAIDTVRFKNKAQAELMARQGAITIAQRNLLQRINGVRIVSETTVQDMITTSDYVYSRIDGILKGAEMVGQPIANNGIVEVTMRVAMYGPAGAENNIAAAVAPAWNKKAAASAGSGGSSGGNKPSAAPLATLATMSADSVLPFALNLTNANGKINPSLLPKVVNENGEVVIDASAMYQKYGTNWIRYVKGGRKILDELKAEGGVQIIDAVLDNKGQIQIDSSKIPNSQKWMKIIKTAGEIGKIAMMFL